MLMLTRAKNTISLHFKLATVGLTLPVTLSWEITSNYIIAGNGRERFMIAVKLVSILKVEFCQRVKNLHNGLKSTDFRVCFIFKFWEIWIFICYISFCLFFTQCYFYQTVYIVGSRGSSQLGGSLLGIPQGYKANKL